MFKHPVFEVQAQSKYIKWALLILNLAPLYIQGVQTLSEKSNLLILPIQSWSIYDSLGSN